MNEPKTAADAIFDRVLKKEYESQRQTGESISPWSRVWAEENPEEAREINRQVPAGPITDRVWKMFVDEEFIRAKAERRSPEVWAEGLAGDQP
jgi:hypothetical protein